MSTNNEIIKSKIEEIKQTGSAAIFEIGGFFVQMAPGRDGEMYCEAVSHNFNSDVNPALESSFSAMGYKLDKGANYSRIYAINTEQEIDLMVRDIERIFRELFGTDDYAQLEVTDVE